MKPWEYSSVHVTQQQLVKLWGHYWTPLPVLSAAPPLCTGQRDSCPTEPLLALVAVFDNLLTKAAWFEIVGHWKEVININKCWKDTQSCTQTSWRLRFVERMVYTVVLCQNPAPTDELPLATHVTYFKVSAPHKVTFLFVWCFLV